MHYSKDQLAELDILVQFNADNTYQGLKIHSNANHEQIDAVERLFYKGLITTVDGGYLTDLGIKAAEHAQSLLLILAPHHENIAS